jgi:predicted MFS family arabinose efflux permease
MASDRHRLRLIAAGIAMVGTTFGLARYGYGLLLPEIRHSFGLSNAALGLIATGSYVAYLVATAAVAVLGDRLGPRRPVLLGGMSATAGMALIAAAPSALVLALGVLIGGVSAALAYPPFSSAVARDLPRRAQGRALATISSGTGWGVAVAVPIALVAGSQWRAAWVAFVVIAVLATVLASTTLRAGGDGSAEGERHALPPLSWSWFVCPRSGPLLVGALLVGVGASVYWTFGPDFAVAGIGKTAGPVLLGVVGVASVLGSGAGDLLERVGGRRALRWSAAGLAASLGVLALWHDSWVGVALSAAAFGATYNLLLAVQAIWSARVFAQRPATGLAAVLFMVGIGQIIGPVMAGVLADGVGLAAAFLAGAGLIAVAALLPPREELRAAGAAELSMTAPGS